MMPEGVRKRALIGCVAVVALLLYVFDSSASDHRPPALDIRDENYGLVDLASGEGTPSGEGSLAPRDRNEGTGAAVIASHISSLRQCNEEGKAYQGAVESFARHYSDIIDHTNPLVHEMFRHSEGLDTMTNAEVEELSGLLSDMKYAPSSGVIGSYLKGYEDCNGYLRAGATSLDLAADSVRGFNETADMEYLRDYRRLITMYMRATADAQWCVSDHLHLAYP